ncbi:hypothetical protein FRC12_012978 [Ceratobasidium sp. 428]|nr:hypothetical protein FRC12_012978 [Ceratobasidium sp. 428]
MAPQVREAIEAYDRDRPSHRSGSHLLPWIRSPSSLQTRKGTPDRDLGALAGIRDSYAQSLLFLVCHSGALASLADAMTAQLVQAGRGRGWLVSNFIVPAFLRPKCRVQCLGYVVVLSGSGQLACQVPKDYARYQLIVVHLTDYILRLGHEWQQPEIGQGIGELLQRSTNAMRQLSEHSEHSTVLMVSAEDELLDEDCTSSLERLFRKQSIFKSAIVSLNLSRFKTRNWVDFVIAIASSHHQSVLPPLEYMASQWMCCSELFLRSDLVIFTRSAPTTMLLASDPSSRPMGRPLPNLKAVCACEVIPQEAERKAWEVVRQTAHGCLAKDVEMVCWQLDTSGLAGRVIVDGGKCCVALTYSLANGWI